MRNEVHVLLLVDGLELNSVVCVVSPACGTSTIEVLFDVMPTETANLSGRPCVSHLIRIGEGRSELDNYKDRA